MPEDAPESPPRYQLSAEDLIRFGFKEYPPNPYFDRCDRCFQYRVRDERGVRFFVQVLFWQHSKYSDDVRTVPDGWSADAQFNTHTDHPTFEVERLSVDGVEPQEIVAFFDKVWASMACGYYELYEPAEEGERATV